MRQEGAGLRSLAAMTLVGLAFGAAWAARHFGRETRVEQTFERGEFRTVFREAAWGPGVHELCRVDPATASDRWCRSLEADEVESVSLRDGLVLVWRRDADGTRFWLLDAADGGNVHEGATRSVDSDAHAFVVLPTLALVAEPGPFVTAIDLPGGAQRWSVPAPEPIASFAAEGALAEGTSGARYALDLARGAFSRSDAPSDR